VLADIVLDTNVLMHADDPEEIRHQMSRALLRELSTCATHLCVDEGFDVNEANNRSIIGSEYLKHLRFGMFGYELVRHLASSLRVKQVPRKVPQRVSAHIQRQVPQGPDRTYLRVAYNSENKTLACHDFDDVPNAVRVRLQKAIGLEILDAEAATALLCL